jgi:UDP-glucose:(heptosyl)LPS alpha-1,3-glucosyltransferase
MRPCLVFPNAVHAAGVERAVWEGLQYFGPRHPTTFVGYALDDAADLAVAHRVPNRPAWGAGALQPAAFRVAAKAAIPRDPGTVTASFGANAPPGDVFVVNSLHRAWLSVGRPVQFRGVTLPNAVRYALPRHEVLLGLEWDYFRRGHPRAVIAVSDVVAEQLGEFYGIQRDLIEVIHNGYDAAQCNPARRAALRDERRAELGIDHDAIVCLFIANELHRKGFGVLLDALAAVADKRLEIHVVGRAPLDDYDARIEQLGVGGQVKYHGSISDIGLVHAIGDLLVLPTQYEAFALTIVEALASGLPVITTKVPGAGDLVVDDVNGRLQHDPVDAEELRALLASALDADRRERWAAAASPSAAGHDWPSLMERYEAVLRGAV